MRDAAYTILCFAAGLLIGRLLGSNPFIYTLPTVLLALLIGTVGVALSAERTYLAEIRQHSIWILGLPFLIAIGSLLGAIVTSLFLHGISHRGSLLVAASLGYYSLGSVLISAQYSAAVGGVALLSNVLREALTLLLAPLFVRYTGRVSVIAAGAATTMDVTLPTIRKTAGTKAVYPALLSGIVLTILVPFLLMALIRL